MKFDKDTTQIKRVTFFWDTVYIRLFQNSCQSATEQYTHEGTRTDRNYAQRSRNVTIHKNDHFGYWCSSHSVLQYSSNLHL